MGGISGLRSLGNPQRAHPVCPGVTTGPPAQAPVWKPLRWAREGNSASLSLCSLPVITVASSPKEGGERTPFLCCYTENLGSLPGAGKANLISSPRGVAWPCLRGGSFPTTLLPAMSGPAHTQRTHVYELGTWSPREEVQLPLVNQEAGPYMLVALVLEAPWEVMVNVP